MNTISPSELIIHPDGSVFHLRLRPGQAADRIVLVGDPGRVETVAAFFDSIESRTSSREFVSATGSLNGKRLTVLSHGIGTDNIDIVLTELDALFNVDFATRTIRPEKTKLFLIRLGTSGALQPDLRIGDLILSRCSGGLDGLLNFYAGRDAVCDLSMQEAFVRHTEWPERLADPYFVYSSRYLNSFFEEFTVPGITLSTPGFYGPQGRTIRLSPTDPEMNRKIETFSFDGLRITNYEMESSALAGLSALLGHEATTICTVIAQRVAAESAPDYHPFVRRMIELALEKITAI